MRPIVFELFANLARLAGAAEVTVEVPAVTATVGEAIALLARSRPELAGAIERCACVSGDTVIRRADALPDDGRIALLPPVAGG